MASLDKERGQRKSGAEYEENTKEWFLAGIRGGAYNSHLILVKGEGTRVAYVEGQGLAEVSREEAAKRICQLIDSAKLQAKIPPRVKLRCTGVCVDNLVEGPEWEALKRELFKAHPDTSVEFIVCCEPDATVSAVSDAGGVVLLLSKRSNCLLCTPDGTLVRCGGWGHVIGDEGSAYWISYKGLKILLDDLDDFEPPPHRYSTAGLWSATKAYFGVEGERELGAKLAFLYDEATVAGLCQVLAERATAGDPLCGWLFKRAGMAVAQHLTAISRAVPTAMKKRPGGVPVVCLGSVWKSFPLLKEGFVRQLDLECTDYQMSLMTLAVPPALGAVYLAADHVGFHLPRDYNNNFNLFFQYNKN